MWSRARPRPRRDSACSTRGRTNLVLSDYALPGRTGAWMLREALARQLLSRGIIVTAHPNPRDADGFPVIYKPLDFDAFLDQVRGYINTTITSSRRARSIARRRAAICQVPTECEAGTSPD